MDGAYWVGLDREREIARGGEEERDREGGRRGERGGEGERGGGRRVD